MWITISVTIDQKFGFCCPSWHRYAKESAGTPSCMLPTHFNPCVTCFDKQIIRPWRHVVISSDFLSTLATFPWKVFFFYFLKNILFFSLWLKYAELNDALSKSIFRRYLIYDIFGSVSDFWVKLKTFLVAVGVKSNLATLFVISLAEALHPFKPGVETPSASLSNFSHSRRGEETKN